jgi:pseudouridine-5'-phosphate glycosidase
MSFAKGLLKISPEVLNAIKHHRPIVALESTIISHGMPYPHNKNCAIEV